MQLNILLTGNINLSGFKPGLADLSGFVKIEISDTGQGIPADQLHKVFDKFGQVSAKKSGKTRSTGLGLTFCKMAVEAHGGEIGVESEMGKGTTIWFTLHSAGIESTENRGIEASSSSQISKINLSANDKKILKQSKYIIILFFLDKKKYQLSEAIS